MIEWIGTHNVGISSRTMWCGLMGVGSGSAGRFDIPHDADDFSRCYDLVTFAEVSPAYDLPRICEIFPWYKPIIDSWETLVELYEKQDYKGVYHLLSSKHAEVMRLQGYEKKQSGIWIKKIDYGNNKRTYNSVLQRPQFQTPRGRFRRLYLSVQQISIENDTPVYWRI